MEPELPCPAWNWMVRMLLEYILVTTRKHSCGKVMFLHLSICSRGVGVGFPHDQNPRGSASKGSASKGSGSNGSGSNGSASKGSLSKGSLSPGRSAPKAGWGGWGGFQTSGTMKACGTHPTRALSCFISSVWGFHNVSDNGCVVVGLIVSVQINLVRGQYYDDDDDEGLDFYWYIVIFCRRSFLYCRLLCQLAHPLYEQVGLTALFTKPPASRFPALPWFDWYYSIIPPWGSFLLAVFLGAAGI